MKKLLIFLFTISFPIQAFACIEPGEISKDLEISAIYPAPLENEQEWVEIHNTGSTSLDLSHYTLEDNTEKPITLTGTLSPQTSIQITDLPFQLNNGGDSVTLKTIDGEILDSLTFESSSSGEVISDENPEVELTEEIISTTLFPLFSEAMPNPEGADTSEEWIELFNPHQEAINLAGLYLDDKEGGSTPYQLSETINAESYLVISIEDSNITLNNSVDSIRLLDADKNPIWSHEYTDPSENESFALINESYEFTNQATPGSENLASLNESDEEYSNGDLSEDLEITEVFPNPEGPDAKEEWIELTNGGNEAVNLGNWQIDDGPGGSEAYTFPDDTIIQPGETLIIFREESNIALNNSDEIVELNDFTGETIDEISYEHSEEGKSFSKIDVEEMSSELASTSGLSQKVFSTWQWVLPSPGAQNPVWKQIIGTVENFDGTMLSLSDGISLWEIQTDNKDTNNLFFQKGNRVLVQTKVTSKEHFLTHSELLESVANATKEKLPWGLIMASLFGSIYIAYELRKRYYFNPKLT
ncbi:lamin tail domain-containing protein [Candidatus Peregrinibacteria bacterium]|jgi:hypothetical protein|nr:lamin tail domain-containing protein [Candidatus Peregrinibacteria bacterium]MBT4632294.1 lamin tail domain-containing protein [Candidatus Peregrinibacteria bacterium]MBT5516878.1 lamin tail domain-containing protein [Candidatus Peregrinibacteria bacterium]MBT5824295.1 lamin tail domain-containing protein [Candidatus Peregrinibacteria bacterium]